MAKKSPEDEHPNKAFGWAARDTSGLLSPFDFTRRNTGEDDVALKILYCGMCHTDLHSIQNEWGFSVWFLGKPHFPSLLSASRHEIAGVVTGVGNKVTKFKVGDKVGVGCMVGSCQSCDNCSKDLENYCPEILTYNSVNTDGTITYGGYSDFIVTPQRYVVRFPDNLPLDKGAPLLCAGVTVYSPMTYYGLCESGMHLGVVGLGGLGHVAVKFGKAFSMKVTVISTSPAKEKEAIERLGADAFLVSRNPEQLQDAFGTMDGIIDTASADHPLLPLIGLLKSHGKLVMVGAPEKPLEIPVFPLLLGRKSVAGSSIGGLKETQEMLDFAGKHNIAADVEVVPMDYVNTAIERLTKGDVRYRFVIDVANTLKKDGTICVRN